MRIKLCNLFLNTLNFVIFLSVGRFLHSVYNLFFAFILFSSPLVIQG